MNADVGRVVAISGAAHGVGRAIALDLARHGFTIVLLHSAHSVTAAAETSELLRTASPNSEALLVDVADADRVAAAFEDIVARHGGIDVVVNGAGFLPVMDVVDTDLDELDRVHRTMIRGTFVMCRQAAATVRRGGAIVNISSELVGRSIRGTAAFVAAAAAVEAMTAVLAGELQTAGIAAHVVSIGVTGGQAQQLGSTTPLADDDAIAATVVELVRSGA